MEIGKTFNYPPLDKFCLSSWVKNLPPQNSYEVRVSDLVSYFKDIPIVLGIPLPNYLRNSSLTVQ